MNEIIHICDILFVVFRVILGKKNAWLSNTEIRKSIPKAGKKENVFYETFVICE